MEEPMKSVALEAESKREAVDWKRADENALVQAVLGGDEAAWRAFVSRYEPVVRHQVRRTLAAFSGVLPSDAVDDVIGEFYVRLLEKRKKRLRVFGKSPDSSRLGSWLGLIATQIAIQHLRRAFLR